MTLTEITNAVYGITGRPDLVAATFLAIQAATLKLHQRDFYSKDIFETGVAFSSSDVLQTFDYKTIIPRWRALNYVRRIDASTFLPVEPPLRVIVPTQLMDDYNVLETDVVYEAGLNLQFRFAITSQYIMLGCYLYPDISALGYSSWIATDFPFGIIYDAAATIFKSIGYAEQEASMRGLYAEQTALINLSNVQALGY
jgi:hypothetical protein